MFYSGFDNLFHMGPWSQIPILGLGLLLSGRVLTERVDALSLCLSILLNEHFSALALIVSNTVGREADRVLQTQDV